MTDWTSGYVVDVDYDAGFQRLLAPSLLDFVLRVRGVRPPVAAGQPFTYLELGCGQGFSTNLLAAANPLGDFRGVDFNPGHMTAATALAEAAGLGNARFRADSFAEFLAADTPAFDYIGLHGVWSWISVENRHHVAAIIARKLKVGGVLYISYNCLPGWAAMVPLRRLVAEQARVSPGPAPARARRMRELFDTLRGLDARYLAANPAAAARLDDLRRRSVPYLAHEYLNRDWHADNHSDLVRDLAPARLTWVGSARLADHVDAANLGPEARAHLDTIEDPTFRETVRDLLVNQTFRHDVFVRGPLWLPVEEREAALLDTRLALAVPPAAVPEAAVRTSLVAALATGPQTLARLMARPDLAGQGLATVLPELLTLVSQGAILPALAADGDAARRPAADRLNAVVLDRARYLDDLPAVASPVLGSGVPLSRLERVFLLGARRGVPDIGQFAWDTLSSLARRLVEADRPLEPLGGSRDDISARVHAFGTTWRPVLEALAVQSHEPLAVPAS